MSQIAGGGQSKNPKWGIRGVALFKKEGALEGFTPCIFSPFFTRGGTFDPLRDPLGHLGKFWAQIRESQFLGGEIGPVGQQHWVALNGGTKYIAPQRVAKRGGSRGPLGRVGRDPIFNPHEGEMYE